MVERIVWQINPGDFHGDTQDMTTAEVGAYFLLLMTYWRVGSLPNDDLQLQRIVRANNFHWQRYKKRLQPLFHDGWKHKRMEADLAKLAEYRARQSGNACGKRGAHSSTMEVHSSTTMVQPVGGVNPLKTLNPTPATAPHSFLPLRKTINSSFGTGSNPDSAPTVDNSAAPDQLQPLNKFQKAWMDALASQLEPHDYAQASKFLLANNELRNRITAEEIRERGSGVTAAMIAYQRWRKQQP